MRVNGLAVRTIGKACAANGSAFLHYSTDHVFSGTKDTPYTEEDLPEPPAAYGVSKLAGEHYARGACDNAYVVRVAGVFGPAGRYTNPRQLSRAGFAQGGSTRDHCAWSTISSRRRLTPCRSRQCRSTCCRKAQPGLYHIGGGETISWYEYALRILKVAALQADVQPTNHREYVTPARRPRRASLSNAKVEALGFPPMPPLEDALADYMLRREKVDRPAR